LVSSVMRRKLDRRLHVEELAAAVALSPSRLRNLFKCQLGVPPIQHLKLLRMDKAKGLLEHSTLSIKEIAIRLSYGDTSRFIEDFRKTMGRSPLRYRLHAWESDNVASKIELNRNANSRIGISINIADHELHDKNKLDRSETSEFAKQEVKHEGLWS